MKLDFRSDNQKKLEDDYVCSLRKDDTLYRFSSDLLFKNIQLAKKANLSSKEIVNIIRLHMFNRNKNKTRKQYYQKFNIPYKRSKFTLKKNAVLKNGYDCYTNNCYNIINFNTENELYEFNRKNNITLLQLTSAFFDFKSNNKIITYCIKNTPNLRKKVLIFMNEYFGTPKSFTFYDLEKLVKASRGRWFISWIFAYGLNDIHNVFHRGINNDEDYIRNKIKVFNRETDIIRSDTSNFRCLKNQYSKNLKKLVVGSTYYKLENNSIFVNLFKKYNKNIISGPSGSASLTYSYIFNASNLLKETNENKVLLLKMVIADYYDIYHSISEILLQYSADAKFPLYDLSMNDIEYINKL
jgi:hypothetical protein